MACEHWQGKGNIEEYTQNLFDTYKPKLEERFKVNLKNIKLGKLDELNDDLYNFFGENCLPQHIQGRNRLLFGAMKMLPSFAIRKIVDFDVSRIKNIKNLGGLYLLQLEKVYLNEEKINDPSKLSYFTMHELCHAVFYKLTNIPKMKSKDIWRTLEEGFSEFASLVMCADLYNPEVRSYLACKIVQLRASVDQKNREKDIYGVVDPYRIGFRFFENLHCLKGDDAIKEVLENPPQRYSEILDMANYRR